MKPKKTSKLPKIKQVSSNYLLDYAGMNPEAAHLIGFNKIGSNEIMIDRNMPFHKKVETIVHEVTEMKDMKKGKTYWQAHEKATKAEKDRSKVSKMSKKLKGRI